MYSSTFIFAPGLFDADFHRLDEAIAAAAREIPGYLGEQSWDNAASGQVCNVYYWESLEALQALMRHPVHQQAKRRLAEWLAGYQVVVAQVVGAYGDGRIDHPLAQRPVAMPGRAPTTTPRS